MWGSGIAGWGRRGRVVQKLLPDAAATGVWCLPLHRGSPWLRAHRDRVTRLCPPVTPLLVSAPNFPAAVMGLCLQSCSHSPEAGPCQTCDLQMSLQLVFLSS